MPKPAPTMLQLATDQLSKPMPPLAVAGIAIAALAVGTWIGSSGILVSKPVTVEVDRAAVETIVAETMARNPAPVQDIVKDYLLKNPEVMKQALAEVIKSTAAGAKQAAAPSAPPRPSPADQSATIKANAAELFSSPRNVSLGNPSGDVTMVEFFDYNCGFCKRAMGDKAALVKDDPKLRIVIKDFPVLGPGSADAARVAIAVRMQDASKVPEFHRIMLTSQGPADKSRALAIAQGLGLDAARLEADMASPEVAATIDENVKLARALGITGTPSYVVGNAVVVGAVGHATLSERIKQARR